MPPATAAPSALAPNTTVVSQVKASVVARAGASSATSAFCTETVGAIAVPPRKSSAPSTHGSCAAASGANPAAIASSPQRYCRGSDIRS